MTIRNKRDLKCTHRQHPCPGVYRNILFMYICGRLSVLEGGDIRRLAMASGGACCAAPRQELQGRCSHIFRPE